MLISVTERWGYSCKIALRWMPLNFTADQSTLVKVMAWCRQASSHYLSQCWSRSQSPYGVTRPQLVNSLRPSDTYTVGTPYNTNVGVQKIPDRAIWKPVVAKRNNTNPWSCSKPQILVTRDSRQVHMAEQPASRDRLGVNFSLHAFITDCLTTL